MTLADPLTSGLPWLTTIIGIGGGFVIGRLTEIAKERRSNYGDMAGRLVQLWRGDPFMRKEAMRAELLKLVFSNDPDLFAAIHSLWHGTVSNDEEASERLVDLIEAMRRSSVLGNVKYRYLGGGPSQRDLISTLTKD